MKKMVGALVVAGVLAFSGIAGAAGAEKGIVETFTDGCKVEIEKYCKDVKPGEGRVVACLYARQDQLSGRCEYAIYDAAAQLERALTALTYVANECRDDLKTFCANIAPGEGRLLKCIEKNDAKVSGRCKDAMKDVGIKK